MIFFGFCHQWFYNRPLNSHDFSVCHTVSLSFSWSHGRFFVSHGCTNFKGIFSETYYFLRKQTRQHNPLSKNIVALSSTYKKISNSVIFDSETSTWSSRGNECPLNYQKFYEKHPSSINLIESVLFRDSFCNNLEISYNCYKKCLCCSVSIKEADYLNKNFCNIDLSNFLTIFFFMYKKHVLKIGFVS